MEATEQNEGVGQHSNALAVEIGHAFLQFSNYKITRAGMQIERGLGFEEWEKIGHSFGALNDFEHFGLGDWLNYGQQEYGERYTQAMDITGHAFETLQGYARVAKAIPFEERRKDLSFSFHKELAAMTCSKHGPEQEKGCQLCAAAKAERKHWLDETEKNGWSLHEFRAALSDAERMKPGHGDGAEPAEPKKRGQRGRSKQPGESDKAVTRKAAKAAEKGRKEAKAERGRKAKGRAAKNGAAPEPDAAEVVLLKAVVNARATGTVFDKAAAVVERETEQGKPTMGARKLMITAMGALGTALDELGEAIQNL